LPPLSTLFPYTTLFRSLPLVIVVSVNLVMSLFVLPRLDFSFLSEERWGATSLSAVMGVWSVAVALAAAILTLVLVNRARLPSLRSEEHTSELQSLTNLV